MAVAKPRVIIIANNIEELGGAQRVVHVLAQGLSHRGYPTELIGVVPHPQKHRYVIDPAYYSTTLMYENWPPPIAPSGLLGKYRPQVRKRQANRARLRAAAIERLREILASGPPGVIICAQLWAMEYLRAAGYDNWKVVGQYHASFEAAANGRDLRRALRNYQDISTVALLTAEDATQFADAGLRNVSWVPNPLSFWPVETAKLRGQTLTYLGRLSAEKGPEILLDAWSRLDERFSGWQLQFIGSGPLEGALRAQAGALGPAGQRVFFRPPVEDPARVLLESDVLALPSLTEGFPLVLAEAMACGLPVVAADCAPGVRVLIRDGVNGLLAIRGDAGDFAEKLARVMDSVELRQSIGAAARTSVEYLQAPQVLDQWESLIAEVTSAH
ncbi:unannotated protein [freshwater metagenome]|uniref:Unannotated protein n=1 Tax=freshwater metagenome TaxID=449393 RepID=A0A6J7PFU7_9ZZZZ